MIFFRENGDRLIKLFFESETFLSALQFDCVIILNDEILSLVAFWNDIDLFGG